MSTTAPNQKQLLILTTWGLDFSKEDRWSEELQRIEDAGYDAIEAVPIFNYSTNPQGFRSILEEVGLGLIIQIHTDGGYFEDGEYVYCKSCSLENHLDSMKEQLVAAKTMNPIHVNVHAGHDSWDHEQSVDFFLKAQELSEQFGFANKLSFETHRHRLLYSPYPTRQLLQDPRIQGKIHLTADLSHWCCVCHTVFDSNNPRDANWWPDLLQLVADHTLLIHCRVGFDQGPQIPDPRDPAYAMTVQRHLEWWKSIWKTQVLQKEQQQTTLLCEMEFGPAPYMMVLPYTNQPVASQWDVNNAMRDMVVQAYEDTFAAS